MRGTTRAAAIGLAIAAVAVAVVAAASVAAAPSAAVSGEPTAANGVWREHAVPTGLGGGAVIGATSADVTDLAPADHARAVSLRLAGGGGRAVRATAFVPAGVPSEGVASTSVPLWQAHGLTGKGVKVAVFDDGFGGLAERKAAGEIPMSAVVVDLCGGKAAGPSAHGTAVAEIVADQAPEAQLYLVCIDTTVSLAAGVAYAKANGVQVANMSGGFFNTWRGDGRGPAGTPDAVVADARASGILWVNAAGNEAFSHYAGSFASADGDPFHEFVPGDEVNDVVVPAGNVVCGFLRWDSWPTTSDDFDLGFYDPELGVVAVSEDYQIGTGLPPREALCVENGFGTARVAGFFIYRYAGTGTPSFDLFVEGSPYALATQHAVPARSIIDPAASPNAVAAGASCWQSGAIEPYSSQGPTIDARTKPDVAAPDSVSTTTYGPFAACGMSGFPGTSAAAPHVAGVAALLRQRFPTLPVDQLQALLLAEVTDAGVPGADNAYGVGNLRLRELPQAVLRALPARVKAGRTVPLRFRIVGAQWDVRDHVHVFRGTKQVRSFVLPFGATGGTTVRSVVWRAPARLATVGSYRFCVEAWDRAGHESRRSCAPIALVR